MKKSKFVFILIFLLLILLYVSNIDSISNNIILFKGETLKLNTLFGLNVKEVNSTNYYDTAQVSSNADFTGSKIKLSINLFDKIKLKDVTVDVIPKTTVIPLGDSIGLKLYTSGVLVVGMSEIEGQNNVKYKPYENSGIEQGDTIVAINDTSITCTTDLIESISNSNGQDLQIDYVRDGKIYTTSITPAKTHNNYKLGLWVRDAAAGVGTLTFAEPSTNEFGALGHGILDIDTSQLIDISKGELLTTNILSVIKGKKGAPGEIRGTVDNQNVIGDVNKNTSFGIYGKLTNEQILNINYNNKMEVISRDKIKIGKASIICTIENNNKKEYEIEIEKKFINNNEDNKSMIIKITDKELLEKTGGIIQGMSGAPIIQDGKFVGAVTHVLVSDPTMGYAIFGDLMIKQMRQNK